MRSFAVVTAVLLLALLASCGSDDEPLATGDGSRSPGAIEGDYRSVEGTEGGEERPLVDDTVIALQLAGGELTSSAGCNTIGGTYALTAGTLEVADLHMTEMACDSELMEQDTWLIDFLTAGPTVEAFDDGLILSTTSTTIRFVDRALVEPDAELVGTTWLVTGFIDGEAAMSLTPPREDGRLRFEENGFVTGHDGCNELSFAEGAAPDEARSDLGLSYEIEDERITFEGGTVQTLIGCDGDEYVERFRAVLTGTVSYEIDVSSLTLLTDDGRGVTYAAQP